MYGILFRAASQTLLTIGADPSAKEPKAA